MKLIFLILTAISSFATLNDVDKTQIFNKNLLTNGGFENGKASWTASAGTFAVTTSSPMIGKMHATWDAAASADTLTSTAVAIKAGMYGRNAVASCLFTTASGTATHEIQAYDGTNVLAETTITSSTTPTRASANFIMPSSGNIQLRIYSNADEPSVAIDDCYLGPGEGYNTFAVGQALLVGTATQAAAANCNFTEATSTGLTDFDDLGAAGSCASSWTTTGDVTVSGATTYELTYNNMPPGKYIISLNGQFNCNASSTAYFRITDGTTVISVGRSQGTAAHSFGLMSGSIEYSTVANRTFKVQVADNAATTCGIDNTGGDFIKWTVSRFPTSQESAYRPDTLANSWSGYHANTCQWTTASATPAFPSTGDATCSLTERTNNNMGTVSSVSDGTGPLPGITFTPKRAGRYMACATTIIYGSGTLTLQAQLYDDTNAVVLGDTIATGPTNYRVPMRTCGVVVATSTSAITLKILTSISTPGTTTYNSNINSVPVIEWSLEQIDQTIPSPVLTGSVVSNYSGVLKEIHANLNCDASSAITSQTGSTSNGVSSIGNVSGGACAITLASGTFSTTPYCYVSPNAAFASVGLILSIASSSSTALSVDCEDDASTACTSYDFNLLCKGAP